MLTLIQQELIHGKSQQVFIIRLTKSCGGPRLRPGFNVFHFFFSLDKRADKDAKLATLQDKRNAIVLILRNCLEKLENLRSKGAANDMQEVQDQQNIVKVKTCEKKSRRVWHNFVGFYLTKRRFGWFRRWDRGVGVELTSNEILRFENCYIN